MTRSYFYAHRKIGVFSSSNGQRTLALSTASVARHTAFILYVGLLLLIVSLALLPKPAWSDQRVDSLPSTQVQTETLPANFPPSKPEIIYPKPGDSTVDLAANIQTSAFKDDDENDKHARTQWRIETSDGAKVVMDLTCQNHHLTDLLIPKHILDPLTSYAAQVRFFNSAGQASPWSEPVLFTTAADPQDANDNRMPDTQELDSYIDLNQDGKDDAGQSDLIRSIQTHDGQSIIGVSVESNESANKITAAANMNPTFLPEPFYRPEEMAYGLTGYKITTQQPGMDVIVILHLNKPIDPKTPWLRYDSINGWEEISDEVQANSEGNTIARFLTDGGLGDADGVANGVIIDMCGPLTVNGLDATISDAEGNASGGSEATTCFIQTIVDSAI